MSQEELRFFQVLRQALPIGFEVWPKANLSDFAPVARQYVDFLLTFGPDRKPALIVDLSEMTTQGFVNQAVDSDLAGAIPTMRVNADGDYVAPLLRNRIERELGMQERLAA